MPRRRNDRDESEHSEITDLGKESPVDVAEVEGSAEELASIPKTRQPDVRSIYTIYEEDSPIAVEFRRTYAKLSYPMKRENRRCFLITSALAGEGKTTAASLLALTVARHRNTKTVIVDADLRRPRIHEFFMLPNAPGLGEVLAGEIGIMDAVKDTRYDNLKVVTCGECKASPTSLLQADKIAETISELKFYFDTVIIDTTPVLPVSDAAQIASETDGILFVLMAGVAQRDVVKRALAILKDSQAEVIGTLVNNATDALPYYYSYNYYGYKY
jgi:capsular exopolysaccharide synthesis family protein